MGNRFEIIRDFLNEERVVDIPFPEPEGRKRVDEETEFRTDWRWDDPTFFVLPTFSQDIEVIPADPPRDLHLGWRVTETIGEAVINTRAVARVIANE